MRLLALTAVFLLALAPAAVALPTFADDGVSLVAFTEGEGEADDESTPGMTMVSEGGIEPVELAPPSTSNLQEDQWTAKFLAPVVALLGILGIVLSIVFYGVRLRGRYRVVD